MGRVPQRSIRRCCDRLVPSHRSSRSQPGDHSLEAISLLPGLHPRCVWRLVRLFGLRRSSLRQINGGSPRAFPGLICATELEIINESANAQNGGEGGPPPPQAPPPPLPAGRVYVLPAVSGAATPPCPHP